MTKESTNKQKIDKSFQLYSLLSSSIECSCPSKYLSFVSLRPVVSFAFPQRLGVESLQWPFPFFAAALAQSQPVIRREKRMKRYSRVIRWMSNCLYTSYALSWAGEGPKPIC